MPTPPGSVEIAQKPLQLFEAVVDALPAHSQAPGGLGHVESGVGQSLHCSRRREMHEPLTIASPPERKREAAMSSETWTQVTDSYSRDCPEST